MWLAFDEHELMRLKAAMARGAFLTRLARGLAAADEYINLEPDPLRYPEHWVTETRESPAGNLSWSEPE